MRQFLMVLWLALLNVISGFAQQPVAGETRDENERVIFGLEAEISKAIESKDLDSLMAFYADGAGLYYEDHPMVGGKDAIRQTWKTIFARPGFSMSTRARQVETAADGDLIFVHGSYTTSLQNSGGGPEKDRGEYGVIYKKQTDGKWKIVADNSNLELGAHAFPKPPDRRIKPPSMIGPLIGMASFLAGIWFLFGMPIVFVVSGWGYVRSRKLSTGFLVSTVMLIVFFATAGLLWAHFSGKFWNMSFGHARTAAVDAANYGHPVEHTAEVLLVNLLIFSTLSSVAAGAITGTVRHFWVKRRHPVELVSPTASG